MHKIFCQIGFLFFLFFYSCSNSSEEKQHAPAVKDSPAAPISSDEGQTYQYDPLPNIKLIHQYLVDAEIEGGQGDFNIKTEGDFNLSGNRIICFSDSNDYFGDKFNGLMLMDSIGKIGDCYLFTADSFGIKNNCYDFFKVENQKSFLQLHYTSCSLNKSGQHYLDSIEEKYWKDNPDIGRPNENRFGFNDVPLTYADTTLVEKRIEIKNGKLIVN